MYEDPLCAHLVIHICPNQPEIRVDLVRRHAVAIPRNASHIAAFEENLAVGLDALYILVDFACLTIRLGYACALTVLHTTCALSGALVGVGLGYCLL
jgi:hypothetical protein